MLHGDRYWVLGIERQAPGQHLEEGYAQRVQVGTRPGFLAARLFRREIMDGA
jgi:hypothetical protein